MNARYLGPDGPATTVITPAPSAMHAAPSRRRQQYTLAEKLAIVRESLQAGVSQASVTRKHKLGKNVLWSWRKSLAGFELSGLQSSAGANEPDLSNLRDRIAELERLLGQKAFEIELLRSRLQSQYNTMEMR